MAQDRNDIVDSELRRHQTEVALNQPMSGFLTYTSTELGFTMKYPHDWKLNENDILNRYKVMFIPPSKGVYVAVGIINNITQKELARIRTSGNKTTSYSSSNIRLLEGDYKHYSLCS